MTDSEQQPTENTQPYHRQPGEPGRWYGRFLLFKDMGPNRTLLGAVNLEADKDSKRRSSKTPGAWDKAYQIWKWRERAESWDTAIQAQEEEKAKHILSTGLATVHGRVEALQEVANAIYESFRGQDGLINPKWIKSTILEQWRGLLGDIASEVGGRVKKQELTGKDGTPIFNTTWGGGSLEDEDK